MVLKKRCAGKEILLLDCIYVMLIFCFDLVLALIQDFSALASQEESFICQASFKVTSTHFFKKRMKKGSKKSFNCVRKESLILDCACLGCIYVMLIFCFD